MAQTTKRAKRGATLAERLITRGYTTTPEGCWEWRGYTEPGGYGRMGDGTGKLVLTHRAAFVAWVGPIPEGQHVCHHCDNPPCINPAHLFLGTRRHNMRDKERKGRGNHPRGELNGFHKLTDAQVDTIRARYSAGGSTQTSLAREFGVSQSNISAITTGLTRRRPTT